jgi:predicted DNA-binding transcriptional regulator AlpA
LKENRLLTVVEKNMTHEQPISGGIKMNKEATTIDRLIDQKEVSSIIGVATKTLERWRWQGTGPKFLKIGRLARYRYSDINEFVSNLGSTNQQNTGGAPK